MVRKGRGPSMKSTARVLSGIFISIRRLALAASAQRYDTLPVMPDRHPTKEVELNDVLHALIGGVQPILADNFVGAYLQGSFAVGDAVAHSDVDFLFVLQTDVPEAQVPALQAG